MSNFNIFDKNHLRKLLEPFAPGITEHITPVKYEALTPDCFLFLFRTTDSRGDNHSFVALEIDFIDGLAGAEATIEDWHGKVIRFWPLHDAQEATKTSDDLKYFRASTTGPYYAMLAEVERPIGEGYWANVVTIMPGDKIGEKIKHYSDKEQEGIRKVLSSILQRRADASVSSLESYQAKQQSAITDDINQTDMAVALYVRPNGRIECFYNYVHPTIGGKDKPA